MPKTMRAVAKTQAAPGAELVEVPIPTIGPNDILVQVKAASMCGTDLHIWNWDAWAQSRIHVPHGLRPRMLRRVAEVGHNVDQRPARRFCLAGNPHHLRPLPAMPPGPGPRLRQRRDPGRGPPRHLRRICRRARPVAWRNPPDLPVEVASIQEPFGNAVHTVFSCDIPTKRVAVIGCGPIGLWAIAICKAIGAAAVFATDVNPMRLDLAERMGATAGR